MDKNLVARSYLVARERLIKFKWLFFKPNTSPTVRAIKIKLKTDITIQIAISRATPSCDPLKVRIGL